MERTKNLTLSENEKKEIEEKELKEKVRGLIQRSIDGTLLPAELDRELTGELEKHPDSAKDILRAEITGRLDPHGNNDRLLETLERYVGIKKESVEELLDTFRSRAEIEQGRIRAAMKARLADESITGSAVIPNTDKDREWHHWYTRTRDELRHQLGLIRGS
jgi:hypothetical protein